MFVGDTTDRLGHSGGEKSRLPIGRGLLQDPFDVVDESHAQHLVCLVQHQAAEPIEAQGLAPHVIHYTTGRTHHDVHAAFE